MMRGFGALDGEVIFTASPDPRGYAWVQSMRRGDDDPLLSAPVSIVVEVPDELARKHRESNDSYRLPIDLANAHLVRR